MVRSTSLSGGILLLLVTACAQPARAPQAPHAGCACDAMRHEHPGGEGMPMMHHDMGAMTSGPTPMEPRETGMGEMGRRRAEMIRRVHGANHGGWQGEEHEMMRELSMLGLRVYPAPMLLRRRTAIGLTPDQVAKLQREVLAMQAHVVDVRAKLEKARIEAVRLLTADKIDEHAIDAQIDEAAKAAAELHKLQLATMLRVRDLLTPDQVKKIDELEAPPRGGPAVQPGSRSDEDDADADDDSQG